MRVQKIGFKTAPVKFRLPQTENFAFHLKTFCRLLVVVFGLVFVSGIFDQEVYASEPKLVDLQMNFESIWGEHAADRQLSVYSVLLKPGLNEYRHKAELAHTTNLYPEFVILKEKVATPTPTTQDHRSSDKNYVVFLLVGGLIVLIALFIVVVVRVLRKLKDLSNGG